MSVSTWALDTARQLCHVAHNAMRPSRGCGYCNSIAEALDTARSPRTWDQIGADRLAEEVAVLVRRNVIDSRSPAADALLDYLDPRPIMSPRADRLAELEEQVERHAYTHQANTQEYLRTLEELKCAAKAAKVWREKLEAIEETILRQGQPWNLLSVLVKLADAAEHLLTNHDCDAHGHEERRSAQRHALDIVAALKVRR